MWECRVQRVRASQFRTYGAYQSHEKSRYRPLIIGCKKYWYHSLTELKVCHTYCAVMHCSLFFFFSLLPSSLVKSCKSKNLAFSNYSLLFMENHQRGSDNWSRFNTVKRSREFNSELEKQKTRRVDKEKLIFCETTMRTRIGNQVIL